ncbi:alkane 1-monooxygenase [Aliiroseovarius sp. F47248L]|uniref:alkane 1-monooxygenase n=1 Tax=Aliiroseovarius sp. F47248L TaxID=2926420 RepID=UPI001FF0F332|nr:alkane 1-monooxygenase [Aliiroseovarius sp. F47248L]MCK0140231.1 alkane 1-monooxygenase [Aliiroseovarius sp. F47248L]
MVPSSTISRFRNAAPFGVSLFLPVLVCIAAAKGGWYLLLPPLGTWWFYAVLDAAVGRYTENADPNTAESDLFWYRFITLIWFPIQFVMIFGMIWYVTGADHLSLLEKFFVFFGVGVLSGSIGIVYAHELMHQSNRLERWLADLLLATVLYSHFRTEHLLVHHPYVGTTRDAVTARYNEGFHRYFFRVLRQTPGSAWRAEKAMLARRGLSALDGSNPFWRYGALQLICCIFSVLIGGWLGLALFAYQAFIAIWQLELTNYVEHYGLTRKHLGDGKYERVMPHHSWNADHRASNWLLINLQRHSDHHYKPARRFPLLQTYADSEAPQLPFGYPVMTVAALIPPVWRRVMNPRVRAWRKLHYPEITDWSAYKAGTLPPPGVH